MPSFIRTKYSFITACIIFCSAVFSLYNNSKDRDPAEPLSISWDVYGYYMHLPNTFIYHDVGMRNDKLIDGLRIKYKSSPVLYQAVGGIDGKKVNVYPIGLALAYAPGFFVAHLYAKLSGHYPADGYSAPYQWSLVITGYVFFLLGLFMSGKILLYFFNDVVSAFVLILLAFGTNYFYHCGMDVCMPHNFLFTIACFIIWFTIKWHQTFKMKYAFLLGFFIGWATISRPTELLWIIVPLLWEIKNTSNVPAKFKLLKKNRKHVLLLVFALVLAGTPQLLYWKYTSGHWMQNDHSETLSLLDPYTFKFLFSFKKGWLIYTPIMFFAFIGFIHLYKERKEIFFSLLIFTVLNIYILSSWECWWYAASFGQRPLTESYCLLMIPLGSFIQELLSKKLFIKICMGIVLSSLVFINLFQKWQFCKGIIDGERMTAAYYWKVFLKDNIPNDAGHLLEVNRNFPNGERFNGDDDDYIHASLLNEDFEGKVVEYKMRNVVDTFSYSGKKCFKIDSLIAFSPGLDEAYSEITSKYYMWIRIKAWAYPLSSPDSNNFALVVDMNTKGHLYKYNTLEARKLNLQARKWNKIEMDYLTPDIRHSSDRLEIYFWDMGKGTVFVDDMQVEALIPKKE